MGETFVRNIDPKNLETANASPVHTIEVEFHNEK